MEPSNELLTIENEMQKKKNFFSKLSFLAAVLILVLFSVFLYVLVSSGFQVTNNKEGMTLLARIIFIISAGGFVFSILSIIKKEKLSFFKVAGAIISILFFLFLAFAAVFVLFVRNK